MGIDRIVKIPGDGSQRGSVKGRKNQQTSASISWHAAARTSASVSVVTIPTVSSAVVSSEISASA